jgi:hypothetical protein
MWRACSIQAQLWINPWYSQTRGCTTQCRCLCLLRHICLANVEYFARLSIELRCKIWTPACKLIRFTCARYFVLLVVADFRGDHPLLPSVWCCCKVTMRWSLLSPRCRRNVWFSEADIVSNSPIYEDQPVIKKTYSFSRIYRITLWIGNLLNFSGKIKRSFV